MNISTKKAILITFVLINASCTQLFAEISSAGKGFLGGAATGAAIGGIAGGGRGAGIGALVGGFTGTAIGASRDDRRMSRDSYRSTRRRNNRDNRRYSNRKKKRQRRRADINRYCEEGDCQEYRRLSREDSRRERQTDAYNNPYSIYQEEDAKAF